MKKENELVCCPDDATNCPHLDRSIRIIRENAVEFACSNPENQDNPKNKVLSITVCHLLKVTNEENDDNKKTCQENQLTCGKFHIINDFSQRGKFITPICFTSNPPYNSVKMCTNIQMYLDFGNSPKTDNQT